MFFDAMVAFVRLKEQCFSKQISDSGYVAELADYKKACSLFSVRKFPVKMHLIVAHLDRAPMRQAEALARTQSMHWMPLITIFLSYGNVFTCETYRVLNIRSTI